MPRNGVQVPHPPVVERPPLQVGLRNVVVPTAHRVWLSLRRKEPVHVLARAAVQGLAARSHGHTTPRIAVRAGYLPSGGIEPFEALELLEDLPDRALRHALTVGERTTKRVPVDTCRIADGVRHSAAIVARATEIWGLSDSNAQLEDRGATEPETPTGSLVPRPMYLPGTRRTDARALQGPATRTVTQAGPSASDRDGPAGRGAGWDRRPPRGSAVRCAQLRPV